MAVTALLQRPATRVFLPVVLSLLVWGSWTLMSQDRPLFGGITGVFSDQGSHMNAARVFTRCGTCLWRQPVGRFLPRYTPAYWRFLPDDIRPHMQPEYDFFAVPGWPLDKPLLLNWSFLPRPYPPGALVLSAPVAVAYHFTALSFFQAHRLLSLSYLLYAHVGFFLLLHGLRSRGIRPSPIGWLAGVILYCETIHWALEGFYDVAMLAPLVLCGHYLLQRRGLAALVCYCVAAFIHYRAFFFAPLSLLALFFIRQEWKQRPWGVRDGGALAAIAVLGGTSLYTFWLLSPWLPWFPNSNPLRFGQGDTPELLLVIAGLTLGVFVFSRAWVDAVLFVWMGWLLSQTYQTMPWHILSLVFWWALPVWTSREQRTAWVKVSRVGVVCAVAVLVYTNSLLPFEWMAQL